MSITHIDSSNWRRVLVVVAHPDDAEYGLSAAVHSWVKAGIEVSYLLLTTGEAGMQRAPEIVGPLRAREQEEACAIVGATDLMILDHPDGLLEYGVPLRRDIARRIRQVQPDVVVGWNFDVEAPWGIDHSDHRATGMATLDSVRDAGNQWLFREQIEEGLEPCTVKLLLVVGSTQPSHAVVLTAEDEAAAVASLECHREYLADLSDHPKPGVFIPEMLRLAGEQVGVERAMVFRAFDFAGVLEEE